METPTKTAAPTFAHQLLSRSVSSGQSRCGPEEPAREGQLHLREGTEVEPFIAPKIEIESPQGERTDADVALTILAELAAGGVRRILVVDLVRGHTRPVTEDVQCACFVQVGVAVQHRLSSVHHIDKEHVRAVVHLREFQLELTSD